MLSEAVFDIYNPGVTSGKKSHFRLVKMRSIQDEQASQGLDLGLSPSSLYAYDIVNEQKESVLLGKEGLKQHDFKFKGNTRYNGIDAYCITFDQKDGVKESCLKGKLWLDASSLAFIAFRLPAQPERHRPGTVWQCRHPRTVENIRTADQHKKRNKSYQVQKIWQQMDAVRCAQ